MAFENQIPEWQNEGTEPSEELKTSGFQGGYKPPAAVFNWFWSKVSKAITELQTKFTGHTHTQSEVTGLTTALNGKSDTGHTHNYAGSSSAGGAATSANKLNTNAGSATNPVYFANGVPVKTTHTLGASVPSDAKFTDTTYNAATTSAAGLMSASDKSKLNGIATGAEVNQNAFSNVTVGSTTIAADGKTDTLTFVAGSNVTLTPDATNDKITIAATDTTYSAATTSAAGLMSTSDKSKLDGIATGANKYTLPVATSSAIGGVKSGTDITVDSSGNVSVNDDSHNHVISNVDGLQTALDGKAASSHNHAASAITSGTFSSDRLPTVPVAKGGTGATNVKGALTNFGLAPVSAASTDGVAYTATVAGITELYDGLTIRLLPERVSASTSPTLNVNGLGAIRIGILSTVNNAAVVPATMDTWLSAMRPVEVTFHQMRSTATGNVTNQYWIVDWRRPSATTLYGQVPVQSGGWYINTSTTDDDKAEALESLKEIGVATPADIQAAIGDAIAASY